MAKITISKEYKDHPSGLYRVKRVRCDGAFYGEIREYKSKLGTRPVRIYWAARLKGEYVRERMAWAIDKLLAAKFMEEGICVTHLGILVTADAKRRISKPEYVEEYWLTKWDTFQKYREGGWNFAGKVGTAPGAKGKEGSNQWTLAFPHFKWRTLAIPDEVKMKEMRVGGRS